MKTLEEQCDREFRKLILLRDGGCVCCGARNGLDCSHFYGRTNHSVRWDEENADALCRLCHTEWEHAKQPITGSYWRYKEEKLGPYRFVALEKRSEEIRKCTKEELRNIFKNLLARQREIEKILRDGSFPHFFSQPS